MFSNFLCWVLIVCSLSMFIGCVHTQPIKKDYLFIDSEKDINVYTKDGKTYKFEKGDYSI